MSIWDKARRTGSVLSAVPVVAACFLPICLIPGRYLPTLHGTLLSWFPEVLNGSLPACCPGSTQLGALVPACMRAILASLSSVQSRTTVPLQAVI